MQNQCANCIHRKWFTTTSKSQVYATTFGTDYSYVCSLIGEPQRVFDAEIEYQHMMSDDGQCYYYQSLTIVGTRAAAGGVIS